jgi:hypothetical protein
MRNALVALGLLAMAGVAHAQAPANCSMATAPRGLPIQPTVVPALSPELSVPSHQLGAPTGVLAQAFDEAQTVDNILFRIKLEGCRSVANAMPAPSPAANGIIDPATYKPQTQFDNTPWRFDMNQNGKRMTAEEFDQWMKARGVRVAKGGGAAAAPAPATTATTPATTTTPAGEAPGTQPAPASPTTAPATPPTTPDGAQ